MRNKCYNVKITELFEDRNLNSSRRNRRGRPGVIGIWCDKNQVRETEQDRGLELL